MEIEDKGVGLLGTLSPASGDTLSSRGLLTACNTPGTLVQLQHIYTLSIIRHHSPR